ncbi:MAG: polysaccharide deacetylase family protein [Blastocatellia bacterium]|nr:polysaccharide deacetylase family protein [Blastocatellia bacterium]
MKQLIVFLFWVLCLLFSAAPTYTQTNQPAASTPHRAVAVTIDDLPFVPQLDPTTVETLTKKLLGHLKAAQVPAVGFVNEAKLGRNDEATARTKALKLWLGAGYELGNHTYSHPYFFKTPLEKFEQEVLQGEPVTKELLGEKGQKIRYFRHPFLSTGPDAKTKAAFETFLSEHGYTVAPVTLDNSDWLFAAVYQYASERGDHEAMQKVVDAYVPYIEQVCEFYEKLSQDTVGYEVRQILLLHANALNANHLDKVLAVFKRRGYKFIPLQEALQDKAYSLPDTYIGANGISWLQRWFITKGNKFREEPAIPAYVQKKWDFMGEEALKREKIKTTAK